MIEKIKVKIKHLTQEQYDNWTKTNCKLDNCKQCPFRSVNCEKWLNYKDMYSDNFLNQEVEIGREIRLTPLEKEMLKNLKTEYKYIARDYNGTLAVFTDCPYKDSMYKEITIFMTMNGTKTILPFNNLFNFILKTDEPFLISNLLKE